MNLLDRFILKHVQVSLLNAELKSSGKREGNREAKVELKLVPRLMNSDAGEALPAYQVSARLTCEAGGNKDNGPRFVAAVGVEAVYQQVEGEPLDLAEFSGNHASLARQLYPLLQQELRMLLMRLGLEQVHLPFDLPARNETGENPPVRVSGLVH